MAGKYTGQRLSVGASRRKTHGKVGLALAGIALYYRQLSKGDRAWAQHNRNINKGAAALGFFPCATVPFLFGISSVPSL